ncbi:MULTISPECIES: hypothetical protein [Pseudomonas]|uniref:hypothetical protein n=1 Tax=Pseudomonas TaxID=286 RepID=UPI00123BDEA9|nr:MULTISPECIES: hypothetical protein [Pseudomonas]QIB52006.1 hypothetical protein G3M63_13670 [Pseudomonas sp. OIL-1]
MNYPRIARLLCLPPLIVGLIMGSQVNADGGHYRAAPPRADSYGDTHYRTPGHYRPAPSVQVQSGGYRLYFSSGDSRPGLSPGYGNERHERNRQHRSEQHYRSRDRAQEYRRQRPQQHNPHAQPGNPRAGENRLGSGNSQMRRPPQMQDPGPLRNRQPERRYR